jgi:hypothetical protein
VTDHSTTSHLPLDHVSVLKALFDAIDSAADIGKKPQSSNILAFRLERIKYLADQYREVAY